MSRAFRCESYFPSRFSAPRSLPLNRDSLPLSCSVCHLFCSPPSRSDRDGRAARSLSRHTRCERKRLLREWYPWRIGGRDRCVFYRFSLLRGLERKPSAEHSHFSTLSETMPRVRLPPLSSATRVPALGPSATPSSSSFSLSASSGASPSESGSRFLLPNPLVHLDVAVGGRDAGRMVFQLFADTHPITAENFRCLCTGETGLGYWMRPRWYKSTPFHRIIPGFMCQGGDIHRGDGRGGESIYGQFFRDERFLYKHSKRGLLSMAKARRQHTNNSQFFITFGACPWLDGEHVVFGQLQAGAHVLDEIEAQGTPGGWRKRPVEIWNCGELLVNSLREIPTEPTAAARHRGMLKDLIIETAERPEKLYEPKEQVFPIPDDVHSKARRGF